MAPLHPLCLRLSLENQHATARACWSAETIRLVFYVIYLYHAAERSQIPIKLWGPALPRPPEQSSAFQAETLCVWACCFTQERGKKKKRDGKRKDEREREGEGERGEERLQQWASTDRVPY